MTWPPSAALSRALVGVPLLWLTACNVYTPDLVTDGAPVAATGGDSGHSGSGGSGGGGWAGAPGSGGAAPSSGGTSAGGSGGELIDFDYELIDDMEDGTPTIVALRGRNGRWDTAHDGTAGTQEPPQGFTMMHELPAAERPSAESLYCAYTSGSGFGDWGAFLHVTLRSWPSYEETPTYDVSAYQGISFLAKAGSSAYKRVRVRYVSGSTDPRGGDCAEAGPASTLCFDHFFQEVTLSEDWERYDLLFRDFVQEGSGKPFPAIDLERGYGFEFYYGAGRTFELWVDDLAFILR